MECIVISGDDDDSQYVCLFVRINRFWCWRSFSGCELQGPEKDWLSLLVAANLPSWLDLRLVILEGPEEMCCHS